MQPEPSAPRCYDCLAVVKDIDTLLCPVCEALYKAEKERRRAQAR